jgi:molybdenum cofactor guanylyltransferase
LTDKNKTLMRDHITTPPPVFCEYPREHISAVVLAGGRGQRLGGQDKGLVTIQGQPLITHILARLRPQAATIFINANRNIDVYAEFGVAVITDTTPDYRGPLAGLAVALRACPSPYLLCVPCDAPLFPLDLGARLFAALGDYDMSVVHDGCRVQPMFAFSPEVSAQS